MIDDVKIKKILLETFVDNSSISKIYYYGHGSFILPDNKFDLSKIQYKGNDYYGHRFIFVCEDSNEYYSDGDSIVDENNNLNINYCRYNKFLCDNFVLSYPLNEKEDEEFKQNKINAPQQWGNEEKEFLRKDFEHLFLMI